MKHLKLLPLALAIALTASTSTAFAQRERASRDDRRTQREQENANLTPEEQQANRAARMEERLKSMTPDQRAAFEARRAQVQQQMKDAGIDPNDPNAWQKAQAAGVMGGGNRGNSAADAMRQMMESAGITDKDTQDAVIAYVSDQNKARADLFKLAQTAAQALQTPLILPIDQGPVDTDAINAKVASTFSAYQTANVAEQERQTKALTDLDAKIHYTTKPRLKSFLTLVGILNNDVLAIGGPTAIFPTVPAANPTRQTNNTRGNRNQGRTQNTAQETPPQPTSLPVQILQH